MGSHGHASHPTFSTCEEPDSLSYYHWINFIFITIVASVGLVSQLVVLTVLWTIKKKTSTDIFLFALSVLDILVIISLSVTENGSIYSHILSPGQQILNAGYISVVAHPFEHIVHFASTWCIVLMSLDRYISICQTARARYWCTVRKAKLQLSLLMVVVTLYSIARFIEYYPVLGSLEEWIGQCDAEVHRFPEGSLGANRVYILLYTFGAYLLFMYLIPLSMLSFFNYHLIRMIKDRISFHKSRTNQAAAATLKKKTPTPLSTDILDDRYEPPTTPKLLSVKDLTDPPNINAWSKSAPGSAFGAKHSNKVIPMSNNIHIADFDSENSASSEESAVKVKDAKLAYKLQTNSLTPSQKYLNLLKSAHTGSVINLTSERSRSSYVQRQYDHVIRMLITVTVVFSICQVPDMVQQLLSRIANWHLADEFGIIAYDFIIINSSINLFIYTATSQRFKRKLYRTFKSMSRKEKGGTLHSSLEHT